MMIMRNERVYHMPGNQSGSTLIISMIILILLMLLGVTAMNTSDTQYKLAGNLQFESLAMNNAEIAENAAEQWLEAHAGTAPNPSIQIASLPDPLSSAMTWTNADSVAVTNNDSQRYVIGFVSSNGVLGSAATLECDPAPIIPNFECVNTYLITARGLSARGATKYIQTYYAVPHK
jgi:type IV pilus assembly protein PilX